MRVLIREPKGKGVELVVRDVPAAALHKRGGQWEVSDSIDAEELARLPVGGPKSNIDERAKKFAERHQAIALDDDTAITQALGSAAPRKKATGGPSKAVNQAAILGDSNPWNRRDEDDGADSTEDFAEEEDEDDAELDRLLGDPDAPADTDTDTDTEDGGDEDEDNEEAELDDKLLELGWSPEVIDDMAYDAKLDRVRREERPPKKGARARAERKGQEDAARREALRERERKEAASEAEEEPEVPAEPPPPPMRPAHRGSVNNGETVRTERRRNGAPVPRRKVPESKPPAEPAPKAADPKASEEEPPAEAAPEGADAAPVNRKLSIRGYRLEVYRKTWPTINVDGHTVPRRYEVGDTPSREEVDNIAARWAEIGFVTEIKELPYHHKAPQAKRTIRFEDPYEPIVCLMPGCSWVGDHFTPHLRVHGVTLDAYRKLAKYTGPIAVGSATVSLDKAHEAIRRRNDIHAGQFCVEVRGTHEVTVWRIDRHHRKQIGSTPKEDGGEAPIYAHSFTLSPLPDGESITIDPPALFARFQPVGVWAQRLLKEMGAERRRT